ncbi:MAG: helix-turn-helix domain-containing protein [Ktedonobacteraceae bacterium]|nr:helix-turn-helix domain-containing protein [Ktedonobacteraceae bacterium]
MEDHKEGFASQLRLYRERAGLSQRALGEKVGVSDATIGYWENGVNRPQLRRMFQLADALSLTHEEQEALFSAVGFSSNAASVNTAQTLQNAVERVAEANPKNIQEVAAAQAEIINSYYLNGLEQSKKSFFWSLIWGGIGSGFLLVAVSVLLFRQPTEIAYASGIGGVLVEMFAGTYLS